jgi:hypothetical protein
MTDFYSNLPKKEDDNFSNTTKLIKDQNVQDFEFNVNHYDTTISFFVKRGFDRQPAEQLAYIILRQAKIDEVNPKEVLDKLGNASPVELSEITQMILNSTRFKSSRLGSRLNKTAKSFVSRNIKG